jgi:hypothetical protein
MTGESGGTELQEPPSRKGEIMPQERVGEKVGNKLEEGLEQVAAGVKELAAKAGIGSGDDTTPSTRRKPARSRTQSTSRARAAAGRTKDELYADAARLGIKGRSKMTKAELEKALRRA